VKLITSQDTIQLEVKDLITITTDDDYPMVELEIAGNLIQIAIYDPDHVEAEVLI